MSILEVKANESVIRRILHAISDAVFRHAPTRTDQPPRDLEKPGVRSATRIEACPAPSRQRLSEAVARLEQIDAERERRADARYGKTAENRIVWSELIELEVQEIDEQVGRIRSSAGRDTQPDLREGGAHERDDA